MSLFAQSEKPKLSPKVPKKVYAEKSVQKDDDTLAKENEELKKKL